MSSRHHTGPPKKRFKSNHHDNTDDVLAKIDSKTKQIDELLAGFDNPNNSLNFIPSSLNKTSITAAPLPKPSSTHKSHNEVTKTITITATSFKIEHHTNSPTPPPPPPPHKRKNAHPTLKKLPLRPLPSPNAKPSSSCLRKTTFTTFRDEKRNKRRSSKSSKDTDSSHVHTSDTEEKSKKRISFGKCVKNQDGVSAKFYSSPQYLIRDGTYLRPKPFQQIENEKRLLQMLGAPEELAGRALPPGLLDEDWEEMYDPQIPNDYSSFVTARQRLEEWIIMRKEQRNIAYQKAMMASQYAVEYIDSEIKKEREQEKASKRNRDRSHRDRHSGHKSSHRDRSDRERDRDRDRKRRSTRDRDRDKSRSRDRDRDYHRRRSSKSNDSKEYGSMGVLPTESPLEAMHCDVNANKNMNTDGNAKEENVGKLSGIDKAAKMMAKFGWKRGDGLGKSKQGLKGCLVPVGGYNQLMSVQDPTNVLLLQNMAGKGEVDMHLKAETIAECKNFGPVLDCIVHETIRKNVSREQQVSVFVKFEYIESCMNALQTFNGRFFDGRRVVASFFPLERFDSGDLEI